MNPSTYFLNGAQTTNQIVNGSTNFQYLLNGALVGAFTPLSLFSGGVQGVWYDPSDLTTMFEDSAGTTAVHTPGNGTADSPVGKILDKSGNGNHATQSTSTKRPTLSAKYNLLTYTEDFSNAAWTLSSILPFGSGSVVDATTSPTGTLTADLITPSAGSGRPRVYRVSSITTKSCTYSIFVKSNGYYKVGIRESASVGAGAAFDLSTGSVIGAYNAGSSTVSNLSISSYNNGWYLISCVVSYASDTGQGFGVHVLSPSYAAGDDLSGAWTPNGTDGIYIWGADLRVSNDGVGLPAYQRVVDANTYDSVGFPYYLKSDGVDDALVTTGNVDLSATESLTNSVALRTTVDLQGVVVENATAYGINGGFFLVNPYNTDSRYFVYFAGTATALGSSTSGFTLPVGNVVTSGATISTPRGYIRINGTDNTSNTYSMGTGNFANRPFYLFSRNNGTSSPFGGRIYGLIIRGAASTAAQISNTETWLNQKAKIY